MGLTPADPASRRRAWRWPGLAFFRLRLFFRGVFLLLALATAGIALAVLQDEKTLADRNYRAAFARTMAQVATQLRHPAGQLALLNPRAAAPSAGGAVHPLLLPYSALDFDDRDKARQAAETAGCLVQYPGDASLCVAVGSNPWAGGFIYVIGAAPSPPLVPHARGEPDLSLAHRVRVTVDLRGRHYQWIAPFEVVGNMVLRGHLAGFREEPSGAIAPRPERDFRGWLWQAGGCAAGDAPTGADLATCSRRAFFSLRLPVEVFRDDLVAHVPPVWPPADLDRVDVAVQFLAPGDGPALLDSRRPGATPAFAWSDLVPLLLPGESLQVRRVPEHAAPGAADAAAAAPLVSLVGTGPTPAAAASWLPAPLSNALQGAVAQLLQRLPVEGEASGAVGPLVATERVHTAAGDYELRLAGDVRSVHGTLASVVTRLSWIVGAMWLALALAWLAIEWTIIRRLTVLTRRTRALAGAPPGDARFAALDVADLRGPDELGVLAEVLDELLQRVNEAARREHIRAEQERDQWMAVGHEIMSPLQSLIALHGAPDDASRRYIERMQQAVRVLYGRASPSEAFQSTTLRLEALDLDAFLAEVARNAGFAGVHDVRYDGPGVAVPVQADAYSLEDVVTHVLQNAQAHRVAGTPITIRLRVTDGSAEVTVHNAGPAIPAALIDRIFEYGVSGRDAQSPDDDPARGESAPNRGQGLFVAKTYMAKMNGTVVARNAVDGVEVELRLPLAAA
jgi:signal transduction histidine kinase